LRSPDLAQARRRQGLQKRRHIKQDQDLATLRQRADCQKLLAELEAKNKKSKR
jgi:hypothetical protein